MTVGTGDPTLVEIGPGALFVAPIGTTEPASASATLDAAFVAAGYTEDGTVFTYQTTINEIEVAEEFDPIGYRTTKRVGTVAFALAEASRKSLSLALNAGVTTNSAVAFEPPAPGAEVRIIIVHDTDAGARWVFRKCIQGGSIEMANRKAPNKKLVPVTFNLEKPTSQQPFKVFPTSTGVV